MIKLTNKLIIMDLYGCHCNHAIAGKGTALDNADAACLEYSQCKTYLLKMHGMPRQPSILLR